MFLDNRTLLVSLLLVSGMMALSVAVASWGREHDCLKKWAGAMALESLAWMLFMTRGEVSYWYSIVLAGVLLVSAQSTKLAAIYDFRGLQVPARLVFLPVVSAFLIMVIVPPDDARSRIVLGSVVFGTQMVLILQALYADTGSRSGRAWWLLFGSTLVILPLFVLRAIVAFFGLLKFSTPDSTLAPNPLQLVIFAGMIALSMLGSMGFILMIKEKADRIIRSLAMIDPLTEIFNRRAFMERASQEFASSKRNGLPLAVMMIDIDFFKRINDDYGHYTGDCVLRNVASVLVAGLRKQDTVGRLGGEEFGILLPATGLDGVRVLAEKLRQTVESNKIEIEGREIQVSISLGLSVCNAACPNCSSDFQRLMKDADAALYQSKHDGRNRFVSMLASCDQQAHAVS